MFLLTHWVMFILGTTAARKMPEDFEHQKQMFLSSINAAVETHRIPAELIINFDQTSEHIFYIALVLCRF